MPSEILPLGFFLSLRGKLSSVPFCWASSQGCFVGRRRLFPGKQDGSGSSAGSAGEDTRASKPTRSCISPGAFAGGGKKNPPPCAKRFLLHLGAQVAKSNRKSHRESNHASSGSCTNCYRALKFAGLGAQPSFATFPLGKAPPSKSTGVSPEWGTAGFGPVGSEKLTLIVTSVKRGLWNPNPASEGGWKQQTTSFPTTLLFNTWQFLEILDRLLQRVEVPNWWP